MKLDGNSKKWGLELIRSSEVNKHKKRQKVLIAIIAVLVVIIGLLLLFPKTRESIYYKIIYIINTPSKEDVLQKMYDRTPVKSAEFYENIRDYVDFADQLFVDSVVPNFTVCDYFEIKEIKSIVENTPASNPVEVHFNNIRESFLDDIHENLIEYADAQKALFVDTIIPLVLIDVDTVFANDFENVINDYVGFVKIFDNVDDFEKSWNQFIVSQKYDSIVNSTLEDYKNSVLEFYTDYYEDLQISQYRLSDLPRCENLDLSFPKENVEKYVDAEIQESLTVAIDTGIDLVLTFAPGGKIIRIIEYVKDGGSVIYEVYKALTEEDVSEEEKLLMGVSEIVNIKITNMLKKKYCQYFDQQTDMMFDQIKEKL
jgi:hypothetical protein